MGAGATRWGRVTKVEKQQYSDLVTVWTQEVRDLLGTDYDYEVEAEDYDFEAGSKLGTRAFEQLQVGDIIEYDTYWSKVTSFRIVGQSKRELKAEIDQLKERVANLEHYINNVLALRSNKNSRS